MKCSSQLHQNDRDEEIEPQGRSNSQFRISELVNKFQHYGKLLSEINVKSLNRGPSTPTIIGLRKTLNLTATHSGLKNLANKMLL